MKALTAAVVIAITVLATPPGGHAQMMGQGTPPSVGMKAPDFTLKGLDGVGTTLSTELERGPVVLVLLRGWPGYQCPFCLRQYGEYLGRAKDFAAAGARVLWVYPGPADVDKHAAAFLADKESPANFRMMLDPDYAFTTAYHLRWDAKDETSYPSTFVIDKDGVIRWALISRSHGGRAPAADVLAALAALGR